MVFPSGGELAVNSADFTYPIDNIQEAYIVFHIMNKPLPDDTLVVIYMS